MKYLESETVVKGDRQANSLLSLLITLLLLLFTGCTNSHQNETALDGPLPPVEVATTQITTDNADQSEDLYETAVYPAELLKFLQYRDVIAHITSQTDVAIVEATVLSINHNDKCPYAQEVCPIEPYPDDWGIVRIDNILDYQANVGETAVEAAQLNSESNAEQRTTSPNQGIDLPGKSKQNSTLQIGQELQTQFLLTARPTIVKQLAFPAEDSQSFESAMGGTDTVVNPVPSTEVGSFFPLSKEGDSFVFTIGFSNPPKEVLLLGLVPGARFRATVRYNETIYVEIYEVIQ